MTNINYDQIAEKYDDVREAEVELINLFVKEVKLDEDSRVLDFGCGTGNYTDKLQRLTGSNVFGVDPSREMINKAKQKNENITFKQGDHEQLPVPNNYFNFIYMTDVIHHVPDIDQMFSKLEKKLTANGKVCLVTESYEQIENRFIVDYFPAAAKADKERYPAIEEIISSAQQKGLGHCKNEVIGAEEKVAIDQEFLELVENKGYSMLELIPKIEYKQGLNQVKDDVETGGIIKVNSGNTLVWLQND